MGQFASCRPAEHLPRSGHLRGALVGGPRRLVLLQRHPQVRLRGERAPQGRGGPLPAAALSTSESRSAVRQRGRRAEPALLGGGYRGVLLRHHLHGAQFCRRRQVSFPLSDTIIVYPLIVWRVAHGLWESKVKVYFGGGDRVRKTPSWPRRWATFSLLSLYFPQECMCQLPSFRPT